MATIPDPEICAHYINQTLLETNVLCIPYISISDANSIFVISNSCSVEQLISHKAPPESIAIETEVNELTKFVIGSPDYFRKLCENRSNVHEVHYNGSGYLKWLQASVGSDLNVLRQSGLVSYLFTDVEDIYYRAVSIIHADRGMGKTSWMKQLKISIMKENEKAVTIYLNNESLSSFLNEVNDTNMTKLINFFEINIRHPNIHIMFDNFEDLPKCCEFINIMTDLHRHHRNIKLWITCCKIETRTKLETTLGTFALYLSPITRKSQILYLKDTWDFTNELSENYIHNLLLMFNRIHWKPFIDDERSELRYEYTSYPLHLKNIASTFKPSFNDIPTEVQILDVYKHFMKMHYKIPYINDLAVTKLCENLDVTFRMRRVLHFSDFYFEESDIVDFCAAGWFFSNIYEAKLQLQKFLVSEYCTLSFLNFFNRFNCRDKVLHTAVLNNNLQTVKSICTDVNINETDRGGRAPLHYAKSVDIVETLLQNGAQTSIKDELLEWTPIQYMDHFAYMEGINELLKHNANVDLDVTLRLSPSKISKRFVYAMKKKLIHYVKYICQNGQNLNITPVNISESFTYLPSDMIMIVLNRAIETHDYHVDFSGKTALFYAVENNYIEIMKYMIDNLKFIIEHKTYDERTIFHVACKHNHIEIIEYLLAAGVDINIVAGRNSSAFMDCCHNNNVEMIKYLITKGINPNTRLSWDETPYEVACANGSVEVVHYLLQNSTELKLESKLNTIECLHGAIKSSSLELVKLILDEKLFNVNDKVREKTALHLASSTGNIDIIKILLAMGANVEATDYNQHTPLFEAHSIEVIKLLFENGCNLLHKDKNGETALHNYVVHRDYIATNSDLIKFITFLLNNGVDINLKSSLGNTPLHLATCEDRTEIYNFLVDNGADINATNIDGKIPSQISCTGCHYKYRATCCLRNW